MKKEMKILIIIIPLILAISLLVSLYMGNGTLTVSITFDDGYASHYYKALPLLNEYNFTATEYIIADKIGGEFDGKKLMTTEQIKELENSGWEVASHTLTHSDLTEISLEDVEREVKDSKEKLHDLGLNITGLAYPYGKSNIKVKEIVGKYYVYGRTVTPGFNSFSENKYYLKAFTSTTRYLHIASVQNLCRLIKLYKNQNKWLIICLHDIGRTIDFEISEDELEYLLQCIEKSEVKVRNVGEVVAELN